MEELIQQYVDGPKLLRNAVAGMTDEQLDATPVAGKWSTRQVVCHLADFEPVYVDRMKRAIAEELPSVADGDPDLFAKGLAYKQRKVETELSMIESVRDHMANVLSSLGPECLTRKCHHSSGEWLSVETLLQRMVNHIPHHVAFIEEKKKVLGI